MLIPGPVAAPAGNLSAEFVHGMGDFDYGLRARRLGCTVWVAPGFVGTCPRNSAARTWQDPALGLRERWAAFCGLKGTPPRQWREFARRHAGPLWPVFSITPYIRFLVSSAFRRRPPRPPGNGNSGLR